MGLKMKLASTACFLATMAAAAGNISTGTGIEGSGSVALSEFDTHFVDNMTSTVSTSHYYQTLMSQDNFTSLTPQFVRAAGLLLG